MLTRIACKAPSPLIHLVRKISRIAASVACLLTEKPWIIPSKKRADALEVAFRFPKKEFHEVFRRQDEELEIWEADVSLTSN